jgi:hypothetical protein
MYTLENTHCGLNETFFPGVFDTELYLNRDGIFDTPKYIGRMKCFIDTVRSITVYYVFLGKINSRRLS